MSLITTVIINPASAGGKTGKHLSEIREKIRYFLGKQTKIRLTTKPNDATKFTRIFPDEWFPDQDLYVL
ncbi:MAG: hypothetical protein V3U02_02385 [Calditrichia bacterium]